MAKVETQNGTETISEPPSVAHAEANPRDTRGGDLQQSKTELRMPAPGKKRVKFLVGGVLLVLVVASIVLWRHYASWESTEDAQVDGHVNRISARISGHVIKVKVEDNQYVEAGTVLVEIDPTDYQVAVESAKAALANDRATAQASQVNVPITSVNTSSNLRTAAADVASSQAGVAAAGSQLDAAQAQLRQAEANNKKAQDDLARYAQLVIKQEISQQQYDQADSAAKAAAAAVDAARATAACAQQQVAQAQSRLAQAQAAEDNARTGPRQVAVTRSRAAAAEALAEKSRSALKQAELNLQYTAITAPVSGIVSRKSVEVGQNVQPGQELLSVVPLDDIWVTANFKETQLRHMKPGQPVKIYVDAYGRDYDGTVENIAGGTGAIFSLLPPENATGNYVKVVQRLPVRIRFKPGQDPDHRLRLGMSVEPRVRVD